ncbi:MCE family protein [Gordonia desulfuricans]|uniref:MCE family protein n=1 Tax=Gordonia desulfuricans TaxID=89051 RepID=A0A7K3LNL4_9ACTN|nr:MCE family protein [Gordonia desulfuricans]NDK89826.1 MCE family protein [Gordonia desulfuricans]
MLTSTTESATTAGTDAAVLRRRRIWAPAVLVLLAVGLLSGCSLIPAGWKAAAGQAIEVSVFFPNVAGLHTTNDVAVLGMPVGQITKIEPQGNRVKVTFTLDKDVPVPADATAAIVNTSIVTTRHIELTPAYSGGARLEDGAVMQNEGMSPVSVGDLFDAVDNLMVSLSGDAPGEGPVADMIDITAGITGGNGERLQEAINQLGSASQVVAGNGDGIVEIVKSVQSLTAALTANYPKMKAFSSSLNQVSEMLGRQSPGLVATLADLNQTLLNTSEFLHNNSSAIGSSTGRLAALAENLSDYSRQVVETIDVGPLLFQNLSNSVSAEQGAWRAQVLLDKSLLDNQLLSQFCRTINLQKNGCETGQLADFGPDLGVFSALLELSK